MIRINEEQIIDFLETQSKILGLEKENCPYYQIMKFITADKEKICKLNKLYYEANENLIKYEKLPKKILVDDIVFNISSERDFFNNTYGFLSNKIYLYKKCLNKEIIILEE